MNKALIVWGGWDGHEPDKISNILGDALRKHDFDVEITNNLDAFKDHPNLESLDLVMLNCTMGQITHEQMDPLLRAVRNGVGIAGLHGGMGDAFRNEPDWQFMAGGQFVNHVGGLIDYTINIVDHDHPITQGVNDFAIKSEQYYMHVDPSNHVLATTTIVGDDETVWVKGVVMPAVWIKPYGKGRVFYCSAGHVAAELEEIPELMTILTRGMLWAAKKL